MFYDRAQLEAQKMTELKNIILQMNGDPSQPTETKEALINRILLQYAKQPEAEEAPDAPVAKPATVSCTIEEVVSACNPYVLRGMKIYHNKEENSWLFRVQLPSVRKRDANTGMDTMIERWKDDSGTLTQPLATIKRCAAVLMQNAPAKEAVQKQFNPSDSYTAVA